MPTQTKRLFLSLVVAIAIAVVYFSGVFSHLPTQASLPQPSPGEVVLDGTIMCLPHINENGPQTLECALGLRDMAGRYYSLSDSDQMYRNLAGLAANSKVEVDGTFTPRKDTKYKTIGTIIIRSITSIQPGSHKVETE